MAGLIVTDASVLIAWLDTRDAHHGEAIDVLAGCDGFVVHPLTLAEVLVHPVRAGIEADVLARLSEIGMVVSPLPVDPARLARLRAASGLRMPDCVVIACAEAHGAPVASFDAAVTKWAAG